jgi:hypothetical protein
MSTETENVNVIEPDAVQQVCQALFQEQNHVLDTYWTVGDTIYRYLQARLNADEDRNISKLLEELSQDVKSTSDGKLEYGASSLRKMLKFRESFTSSQVERLKSLHMPVSKLIPMCANSVSNEDREDAVGKLESGERSPDDPLGRSPASSEGDGGDDQSATELGSGKDRSEPVRLGPFQAMSKLEKALRSSQNLIEEDISFHLPCMLGSDTISDDDRVSFCENMVKINNIITCLNTLWADRYAAYDLDV